MTGRLIAVGVGPGDPELVTLKALRALERADVVAHFAKAGHSVRVSGAHGAHQHRVVHEQPNTRRTRRLGLEAAERSFGPSVLLSWHDAVLSLGGLERSDASNITLPRRGGRA